MKRITAVFLAATALLALSGCGLAMDETIDDDGNVRKLTAREQAALQGADPVINPDPNSDTGSTVPGVNTLVNPLPTDSDADGDGVADENVDPSRTRNGGTIGLPQDPIPLVIPGKPQGGPGSDPRVNPYQ